MFISITGYKLLRHIYIFIYLFIYLFSKLICIGRVFFTASILCGAYGEGERCEQDFGVEA
jgi:hypothetical protein